MQAPSPRQFNPAIPPALEQILLKVLSKEPSARYRTADQFGRVLMTFNRTTTVTSVPEIIPPRTPHRPQPAPTRLPAQRQATCKISFDPARFPSSQPAQAHRQACLSTHGNNSN